MTLNPSSSLMDFEFVSSQYLTDTAVEKEMSNLSLNINRQVIESPLSPVSSKGSLSPSLFEDLELQNFPQTPNADELPIFTIKSLSPGGRSISPIDSDYDCVSPCLSMAVSPDMMDGEETDYCRQRMINEHNFFDDFMTLDEIHEQIDTPKSRHSKNLNLETIFEGVFLETPPKEKRFKNH